MLNGFGRHVRSEPRASASGHSKPQIDQDRCVRLEADRRKRLAGQKKRILVVCYSQTGQLRRCAESLVAPLREGSDVEVDFLEPAPRDPYPFPWTIRAFLDAFPESVLQIPPEMQPVEPPAGRYDLVVLCYQVWYLSPSLPVTGFLRSSAAKVLAGTPVIALCACRNMWHCAWIELRKQIEAAGGRVIDHIVLVDQGPAWATFVTTPRWLWTGKKAGFGPFPAAGVSDEAIAGLRSGGQRVLQALRRGATDGSMLRGSGFQAIEVNRRFVVPEVVAQFWFRLWATFIRRAGEAWRGFRFPLEVLFLSCLSSMILLMPILLPLLTAARFVMRSWYRNRLDRLLQPSAVASPE